MLAAVAVVAAQEKCARNTHAPVDVAHHAAAAAGSSASAVAAGKAPASAPAPGTGGYRDCRWDTKNYISTDKALRQQSKYAMLESRVVGLMGGGGGGDRRLFRIRTFGL